MSYYQLNGKEECSTQAKLMLVLSRSQILEIIAKLTNFSLNITTTLFNFTYISMTKLSYIHNYKLQLSALSYIS